MLTPYLSGVLIDVDKIQEFVQQAYRQAGLTPETIDTGAVVITGEALKKENAQPISELFAKEAGKFICASAGPNHEALLAAHGCGAVALSQDRGATVLNVDVGGGTTKLSLVKGGVVVNTGAIEVGARLIAFDESNMITRLEEPGKAMLESLGYSISAGPENRRRPKGRRGRIDGGVIDGSRGREADVPTGPGPDAYRSIAGL